MDFIITAKNKRKAQKRRIRKEEKWKGLHRFVGLLALVAISISAFGTGTHFSNIQRKIIDSRWELKGYAALFYDYYEPSLVNHGVPIEVVIMDDNNALESAV